jgi:hypothetical protein
VNQKTSIIAFVSCLFLASCSVAYSPVGGRFVATSENFAVNLPQGWWQHNLSNDQLAEFIKILEKRRKLSWDRLRLTRDGLLLQQIAIGRVPVADELPYSKRKLAANMIPLEAAEVMSNNFRSNPNLSRTKILENAPATLGGYPGFRLHYTFATEEGLNVEGLFYGTLVGQSLYYVLYEAPAQHYFAKDLQLFENTRSSFEIIAGARAQ